MAVATLESYTFRGNYKMNGQRGTVIDVSREIRICDDGPDAIAICFCLLMD